MKNPGLGTALSALLMCTMAILLGNMLYSVSTPQKQDLLARKLENGTDLANLESFSNTTTRIAIPFGDLSTPRTIHTFSKRLDPISVADWDKAIQDGGSLTCLMQMTADAANKAGVPQSAFKDPTELSSWGWMIQKPSVDNPVPFKQLSSPILSRTADDWSVYKVRHMMQWSTQGKSGRPSNGYYTTHIGHDAITPVILSTYMFSPEYMTRMMKLPSYPDLRRWSDVVFLAYYKAIVTENLYDTTNIDPKGGSKIPCPVWYLINDISQSSNTQPIFEKILSSSQKSFGSQTWPGMLFGPAGADVNIDYEMTSENGKAMLGCAHAKAIAYFLIQHKDQLGVNEVKYLRVWVEKDFNGNDAIQMAFKLGPVSTSTPPSPRRELRSGIEVSRL
ncbi:hypothetical protein EJ08DRAFT_738246 [Tothia fuscella]|uniref:Uncharacterized protein n=1 Tax=Tothia fuscella TaxID=1048955 RepID=A0A9P4NH27_9PEZI|nr:hypothetical protein EJ08DRAFT_738246 [Tothia fuscella]